MLDTIRWSGARLAPASKTILAQVGATLRAHPEILRLKIVSHVNPSGNARKDKELTQKRAIAIREWLITWGVAPTRLSGQGAGGNKPLVPPTQKSAAQLNDRIELIILEKQ
jgi:outer membrane protein OmpA-like peptidoglycan-associated protein